MIRKIGTMLLLVLSLMVGCVFAGAPPTAAGVLPISQAASGQLCR